MKRALLLSVLAFAVLSACDEPEAPDTTVPVVEIIFSSISGGDYSVIFDAYDEGGNLESIHVEIAGRTKFATMNPNGTWSADFTNLPAGSHTLTATATDTAGWTDTVQDDVDI